MSTEQLQQHILDSLRDLGEEIRSHSKSSQERHEKLREHIDEKFMHQDGRIGSLEQKAARLGGVYKALATVGSVAGLVIGWLLGLFGTAK